MGSYNEGEPDNRWANHANDAMFGGFLPGETFPRLYVTAGNSVESDEHGYIAYCAVEQIRCQDGVYSSETFQRIYYKNDGIENSGYRTPGFGWPMSLVDADGGWYYMFSARYRTRKECAQPDNTYIITKFPLPDPGAGDITLYPKDIVEQFELPFNVFFTQGGTLKDGRIWYMFGCGKDQHPNAMRVIDLKDVNMYSARIFPKRNSARMRWSAVPFSETGCLSIPKAENCMNICRMTYLCDPVRAADMPEIVRCLFHPIPDIPRPPFRIFPS